MFYLPSKHQANYMYYIATAEQYSFQISWSTFPTLHYTAYLYTIIGNHTSKVKIYVGVKLSVCIKYGFRSASKTAKICI